jgi:ribosomal protein L10
MSICWAVTRHRTLLPFFPARISFTRSYALSVEPSRVYPRKPVPRPYSEKKTLRYNQYTRILEASTHTPLIFLQHTNFTAERFIRLRRDIVTASDRARASNATDGALHPASHFASPTLTVIRTGIFGVALREFAAVPVEESSKLAGWLNGPLAVLSLPSLLPPQLHAILRAMDRAVPPKKPKTQEQLAKELEEKNADPVTPGRRIKRQRPVLAPELKVVGALIEGRIFSAVGLQTVATLPSLDTMRAQLVGLLGMPSMQLVRVLGDAGGGKLVRLLEGLKLSLEEVRDGEQVS